MRAGRHSTYRRQRAGYLHRKNSSYRTFEDELSPFVLSQFLVHPVPDQTPGGKGRKVLTAMEALGMRPCGTSDVAPGTAIQVSPSVLPGRISQTQEGADLTSGGPLSPQFWPT